MSFTEKDYNELSGKIIEACIEVHKEPGPGLMKSVYEVCLISVLRKKNLIVNSQVSLPVVFKGEILKKELKSVEAVLPVHEEQLVTYPKLSGKKLGLLINFNVPLLTQGIRRKINGELASAKVLN